MNNREVVRSPAAFKFPPRRKQWTFAEALVYRLVGSPTFHRVWLGAMRRCFSLDLIQQENVPLDRAVIFAGNHASHYDGLFALTAAWLLQERPPAVVAWAGIRRIPFAREVASSGAMDLIMAEGDLLTGQQAAGILANIIDRLDAGRSVVLHAEGHRHDALGEFMQGAAAASITAGAPIVPFTLRGVHGLWSQMPWPARWRGDVSVVFHPPLDPQDYGHLPLRTAAPAMTAELRRRVASAIDYPDDLDATQRPARMSSR